MAVVWSDETTNRIREIAMQQHRRVFAIGRRQGATVTMRRRCMACHRWLDAESAKEPIGPYRISDGVCGSCATHHFEVRW